MRNPGVCFSAGAACLLGLFLLSCSQPGHQAPSVRAPGRGAPKEAYAPALDLREPMALGAAAIARRLDPARKFRPWFLIRGTNGVPSAPEHASWDLADMTGRYLESLIQARRMGIVQPELIEAEERLRQFFLSIIGEDGLVHDPDTGAVDHSFSHGSALFGLLAWFEDTGDPVVRRMLERLISAQLKRAQKQSDFLVDPTVKLEKSSGSHLAGYQIWPVIRFYELTGYADALEFAEGLTRWALSDPVIGPEGEITLPLSWEGHIHSWLETMAGCVRTARNSKSINRSQAVSKASAVYAWVKRTNATRFGWIATYPTGGSSEACAISSAIRLALELAAKDSGVTNRSDRSKSASSEQPYDYFSDVERFVRNQVIAAQFRDLGAYHRKGTAPTPLLVGCFDSQSMPNGHLGTRGGEDVGTVEGCCLNGGMRALALAWDAIESSDESGLTVNLSISRAGPGCTVIGYQPFEGRVDIIPQSPGSVRVRVPEWVSQEHISVSVDGYKAAWWWQAPYVVLPLVQQQQRVCVRYPLRSLAENVLAGGQRFTVEWKGDVVVGVNPKGGPEPTYTHPPSATALNNVSAKGPDTCWLQNAARLAGHSMLARLDLAREGQPFFRIYPFADPPRAEHEKWDDGDMSGRYVEALIYSRRLTGTSLDSREILLRTYLAGLLDAKDGLCYARATEWTPRRACLFSQSSAMLGLLAWYRETGSPTARTLLDKQIQGLMHIAKKRGAGLHFPKYEFDGTQYLNEPVGKDAPPWYGGRLILPLVDYWQITGRQDVRDFVEQLCRYVVEESTFIKPDGAVESGEGWWGHLHGTMDMTAGVAKFGRLTRQPALVEWAKRIYDWIGSTHTTHYGWVADVSGGRICESCAIASRMRLGLELYRSGAADPFGEMDRHLRNQLMQNQFVDLSFMKPEDMARRRTDRCVYNGIGSMIRGTFQCWGTANDLIGNDDIEGCGAGGGVQALMLAWEAQNEWREDVPNGELRIHLLFNRVIRSTAAAPFKVGTPAARLWTSLPYKGEVSLEVFRKIGKVALRLPDGANAQTATVRKSKDNGTQPASKATHSMEGSYLVLTELDAGENIQITFRLREYETTEKAAGLDYHVKWKGSSVVNLSPPGSRVPLYQQTMQDKRAAGALSPPRYPE